MLRLRFPSLHCFAVLLWLPFAAIVVSAQSDIRINVGGTADWTDGDGQTWKKDDFTIGQPFNIACAGNPIAGSNYDTIYCSQRYFKPAQGNSGPYLLNVPVTQAGDYKVRLHFAETVSGCQWRFWFLYLLRHA